MKRPNNTDESKPLLYLASPFSHPIEGVRVARYVRAVQATASLLSFGVHVYSPIVHNYSIPGLMGTPNAYKWETWRDFDSNILVRCDCLIRLEMDGLEESEGVQAETTIALEHDIPVFNVYYRSGMVFCDLPAAGCPVNLNWVEIMVKGHGHWSKKRG